MAASPSYFTVRDLAQYSGLSVRTIQRHLAATERPIPYLKVRGRVLVSRDTFEHWLSEWRGEGGRVAQLVREVMGR